MRRLVLAILGLVAGLLLVEIAFQFVVRSDPDGQRWLGRHELVPRKLPLRRLVDRLEDLATPASVLRPDPDLGWVPRPGARSRDGRESIDEDGFRRGGRGPLDAEAPLRIVVLGDSFAYGAEVADAETWPAQLGQVLTQSGQAVEVINLGVKAYGLDQAVLRFERDGMALKPDVVILGIQPENLMRNLNVLRAWYHPRTSIPLSKPRFVVEEKGISLVNQPTLPLVDLPAVLADPFASEIAVYEGWLDDRYLPAWWQRSLLLSWIASVVGQGNLEERLFRLTPEMVAIGDHAVDRLAQAVENAGARLVLVHTPRRADLKAIRRGRAPWYADWLRGVEQRYDLVRPDAALDTSDAGFAPRGHYSAAQNRRVAESLAGRF